MRACAILLLASAACGDPVGTGEASSSVHPTVRSAFTIADRVTLPQTAGSYYLWRIGLFEDAPGTDCSGTGEPIVSFDVYTIFSSAPRGAIPLDLTDPPPQTFPTAYPYVFNGFFTEGSLMLTSASSSGISGSAEGIANVGTIGPVEIVFDAPTCGP